jgi:hypothetical protein
MCKSWTGVCLGKFSVVWRTYACPAWEFAADNHLLNCQSKVILWLTVSQSVSLGVETCLGLMTIYIITVTVLFFWGALSARYITSGQTTQKTQAYSLPRDMFTELLPSSGSMHHSMKELIQILHSEVYLLVLTRMNFYKVVIIEACQRVMDHTFSFWQKETTQEECGNWRKSSEYSGTVLNQCLQYGVKNVLLQLIRFH